MSSVNLSARRAPPPLGEHTREVATEMGWAGDDLERTLGSGALQETRRGEE
jgi:crotonobetainyl-CoA:carnitine CoA-transferase CaiB-like acyl-CoA transferase